MNDIQKKEIRNRLNGFAGSGTYCKTLFDPIQTHAIYGVSKTDKDTVKQSLKKIGAKKFRIVNANGAGLCIICFDANGIK